MSNKSGVSSQVITLPSGGGALAGIGETFAPDLFTGTGNFTIPLPIIPGRNGFQPTLSLVYSTGSGSSPFGLGWDLPLPRISRKTSHGTPHYRDESQDPAELDTFILSGTEDLVPVTSTEPGVTRYQPRTERSFARIERIRRASDDYWRIRTQDGLVSLYGLPGKTGQDPSVLADPNDRGKVFSWHLTQTSDPFGNRIEYEYLRDSGQDGPHQWDKLYLQRVRYIDYDEGGVTRFLVSVTFVYEERSDPFSQYRAGFEIRSRLRCRRIEIRTHTYEDLLVRTVELVYLDDRVRTGELQSSLLPPNGVSLLNQVRIIGHDGDRTQALPPLEFGYTRFDPASRRFQTITANGNALPSRSLASDDFELVDLFGNGLPDIVQMDGAMQFWRNLGGGQLDRPQIMPEIPAGVHLRDPGVQFGDLNGNGRADLLALSQGGYFPMSFTGRWSREGFVRYSQAPIFKPGEAETRLVDLDGDGVVDALRTGAQFELFFNHPSRGWNRVETKPRLPLEEFPNLSFSDPRSRLGEMTGDGMQDFVFINQGRVDYWPYLGHGRWGRRVTMASGPVITDPAGFDPKRALLGDLDGDGLDDLVYVQPGRITLWINQGGNRWSSPITIEGTPSFTDIDAVRLVDMLGTGIAGILWTADSPSPDGSAYRFLDLTGSLKPYLLSEMDNHRGAVTRVDYTPSTEFYQTDFPDPKTRWQTPLPFPVQVVSHVEVIDAISQGKLTTEYRYHHGYWDGSEREFRGFGRVEQLDTQSFEAFHQAGLHGNALSFQPVKPAHFSPPVLTKTWFHLGDIGNEFKPRTEADLSSEYWAVNPPLFKHDSETEKLIQGLPPEKRGDVFRSLRGSVLRTELYAMDGSERANQPYTVTESRYAVREENRPADRERERVFFPHLLAKRITQWERGSDPLTQFSFFEDFDELGRPHQTTLVGLPRRATRRKPMVGAVVGSIEVDETRILATHTRTEYAHPEIGSYIHNRVSQVRTYELTSPPSLEESQPDDLRIVLIDQAAGAEKIVKLFRDLLEGSSAVKPLSDGIRLINHVIHHYDGAAFEGLEAGKLGQFGALSRSEALIFTKKDLQYAYSERLPIYLGGSAELPPGAPAGFGSNLGFHFKDDSQKGYHPGYYADTQRQEFDFQDTIKKQQRGLVVAIQDALLRQTLIEPDKFWLMPKRVTEPTGLEMIAEYDYRLIKLRQVTDQNGNTTYFLYTPLGLLVKTFLTSRTGEGGSEDKPEIEFTYDFMAYELSREGQNPQPIFVHTRRRIHHASQNISDETIEAREYSDGFGQLIQLRTQAEELAFGEQEYDVGLPPEPGSATSPATGQRISDRVIVSGWQVYDNKGQVVEKYEPFFSKRWIFQPEEEVKKGQPTSFFYDPRGQAIRTLNPDGSEQRVIFGIPPNLKDPAHFLPTPWESYTYDPNDLAPLSFSPSGSLSNGSPRSLTDRASLEHHFTPNSTVLDAFGRVICEVAQNGLIPEKQWFITRSSYDLRSNLIKVTDALGRNAISYAYDLANNVLKIDNIDAGRSTFIYDAAGNQIEYHDSKGSAILHHYDSLNRLTHLWARNDPNTALTLREHLIYGDDLNEASLSREAILQNNLFGRKYLHYDEAGLQRFERYDYKGNLEEKVRQVISDTVIGKGWIADWSSPDCHSDLDPKLYRTDTQYDALNRATRITYPQDVNSQRAVLIPHYNRAGVIEKVELDGEAYVAQIAYNARGQRTLIAYGNQIMTRYAYDPLTFRLSRFRSEKYSGSSIETGSWMGEGAPLQDFTYQYDLVGNVTVIEDRTPNCGIADNPQGRDRLTRTFDYDPLYRLIKADGRACKDIGVTRRLANLTRCGAVAIEIPNGAPTPNQNNAPELTEFYTETYQYDPISNLLELRYQAGSGAWRRSFGMGDLPEEQWPNAPNNRLTSLEYVGMNHRFMYDKNGNLQTQNTDRCYTWDHADRLIAFIIQADSSSRPSVDARYLYGADGMRIKKWVQTNGKGLGESVVYIDGIFEHHRWDENGSSRQNCHLHIMDHQEHIALIRRGESWAKDVSPPIQYQLVDHLGSSSIVIGSNGDWINREEFFPYGETSFGGFAKKAYRFINAEHDTESQLYYVQARYYIPCLARWACVDEEMTKNRLWSPYSYAKSNPIRFVDRNGQRSETANTPKEIVRSFVEHLRSLDMPTQFLNKALQRYPIQTGDKTAFSSGSLILKDYISISQEDLEKAKRHDIIDQGTGIIHELTHAYLESSKDWRRSRERWRSHYDYAPMEGGKLGGDDLRVLEEAAAEYVESRMINWHNKFEELQELVKSRISGPLSSTDFWKRLDLLAIQYNIATKERVFGYEEGYIWFKKVQIPTLQPISIEVKDFLDREVLEGKIYDNFYDDPRFRKLYERVEYKELMERLNIESFTPFHSSTF